jgi:hypothetical protein
MPFAPPARNDKFLPDGILNDRTYVLEHRSY